MILFYITVCSDFDRKSVLKDFVETDDTGIRNIEQYYFIHSTHEMLIIIADLI